MEELVITDLPNILSQQFRLLNMKIKKGENSPMAPEQHIAAKQRIITGCNLLRTGNSQKPLPQRLLHMLQNKSGNGLLLKNDTLLHEIEENKA